MVNSVSFGTKYVGSNPVQLQFFLDIFIFLLIPVFICLFFSYISNMDILI